MNIGLGNFFFLGKLDLEFIFFLGKMVGNPKINIEIPQFSFTYFHMAVYALKSSYTFFHIHIFIFCFGIFNYEISKNIMPNDVNCNSCCN